MPESKASVTPGLKLLPPRQHRERLPLESFVRAQGEERGMQGSRQALEIAAEVGGRGNGRGPGVHGQERGPVQHPEVGNFEGLAKHDAEDYPKVEGEAEIHGLRRGRRMERRRG